MEGLRRSGLAVLLLVACGPGPATTGTDASSSEGTASPATDPSATSASATSFSGTDPTGDASTSTLPPGSSGDPMTGDTTAGVCDPAAVIECGGGVYQCGNGVDDDGDGLVDMADPECVTPCNDDEYDFRHIIPGDNMDCRRDCYFDGNSGQGDDGCQWDLRCDPLSPGSELSCRYNPGSCIPAGGDPEQCADFCGPRTLNGCDCFGCCTFEIDGQSVDLFLDSIDCRSDQLESCAPCTSQIEQCGNPCEPRACEICIGQTEPPPGCEAVGCVGADPCETHCDCGPGEYCGTGCCVPMP